MKSPQEIVQDLVDEMGVEWLKKALDYVERTGGGPHRIFSLDVIDAAKAYILNYHHLRLN
jgi:hypothetical protein